MSSVCPEGTVTDFPLEVVWAEDEVRVAVDGLLFAADEDVFGFAPDLDDDEGFVADGAFGFEGVSVDGGSLDSALAGTLPAVCEATFLVRGAG